MRNYRTIKKHVFVAVALAIILVSIILVFLSILDYPNDPVAPFHVDGRYVVDNYGRKTSMKGFQLDEGKIEGYRNGYFSQLDYNRLKDWGYHFAYNDVWWWRIENEDGSIDRNRWNKYKDSVNMAEKSGLHYIFRFRVSFNDANPPSWQGWTRHSYVSTEVGLARYCEYLEWAIADLEASTDAIVAYSMWQFPFHQSSPTTAERNFYYDRVVPEMIESARKVTNKPLIVSSMHCKPENFDELPQYSDDQILYGFTYYKPQYHESQDAWSEPTWGSQNDIDYQWETVQNAVDYMNTYDVPLQIVEFGIRIDRQDQLDKLRLKLQIFDHYEIGGWCIWAYTWYGDDWGFGVGLVDDNQQLIGFKQNILNVYSQYKDWKVI